jgi:uncharacterized protein YnzC (UPF0291/DUF896 family)
MSYNNIFPSRFTFTNEGETIPPSKALAVTEKTFVKPLKSFYFRGLRQMKDLSYRHYLVQVTQSGNLTAYITEDGTPVYEQKIPLTIKKGFINSIPGAIKSLKLTNEFTKLESKEFRKLELQYLESIKLPSLGDLHNINLTDTESVKLTELADSYRKLCSRSGSIFAAHVRQIIKSRK